MDNYVFDINSWVILSFVYRVVKKIFWLENINIVLFI